MLTIGVDTRTREYEAVALDAAGHEAGRRRVPNRAAGRQELLAWAVALSSTLGMVDTVAACRWGVEGAWGYGRGLAHHLVPAAGRALRLSGHRAAAPPRLRAPAHRASGWLRSRSGSVTRFPWMCDS
jgi:hypothetical protein